MGEEEGHHCLFITITHQAALYLMIKSQLKPLCGAQRHGMFDKHRYKCLDKHQVGVCGGGTWQERFSSLIGSPLRTFSSFCFNLTLVPVCVFHTGFSCCFPPTPQLIESTFPLVPPTPLPNMFNPKQVPESARFGRFPTLPSVQLILLTSLR